MKTKAPDRSLQRVLAGFIRMHVLHHAAEGGLYGNWMIGELRHHGYSISAGTLYPLLRNMERDGWLEGRPDPKGSRRRFYHITPLGRAALQQVRERLQELFREVAPDPPRKRKTAQRRSSRRGAD